jgi:hypothetical protein
MGMVIGRSCGHRWEGSAAPRCPACLAARWLAAPDLILEKHDPDTPPFVSDHYRSVLSHDFLRNRRAYLEYAATHGSWYFQTFYQTWSHYTPEPLGRSPGAGIPAGAAVPDHQLDGLLIADALDDPHVFAVDPILFLNRIDAGDFVPLKRCLQPACDHLRVPGQLHCALHTRPRQAD